MQKHINMCNLELARGFIVLIKGWLVLQVMHLVSLVLRKRHRTLALLIATITHVIS